MQQYSYNINLPMAMEEGEGEGEGAKLRAPLLLPSYHSTTIAVIRVWQHRWLSANGFAIVGGPLLALLILLLGHVKGVDSSPVAVSMLAVMGWVFAWWTTEAVPIAVTSLVPLFAMPLLQIRKAEEVAKSYACDTTFLITASFIMAAAVQHHGLHKRVSLRILHFVGPRPRLLLLAFMCFAALLSMLIDNAPVAGMLMPLAVGLLQELGVERHNDRLHTIVLSDHKSNFGKALIYGITYSVTLGGMATLTGNGANLVLPEIWQTMFPESDPVEYVQWLLFAFPLALAILVFTWVLLCRCFCPLSSLRSISTSLHSMRLEEKIHSLGPMPFAEKSIVAILLGYIVLLLTESKIGPIPGWEALFNGYAESGTVTVLMASLFFVIPDGKEPGRKFLDWQSCAANISWSTILLIGGGFALADGFESSGLTEMIKKNLEGLQNVPFVLITPAIALMTGILTEFTSNVSATSLFLPTMAELAVASHRHPLWFMVPTSIGCQFSFMLPVATPANAIAYSTGHISMGEMAIVGIPLKLFGLLLLSLLMPSIGTVIFSNKY